MNKFFKFLEKRKEKRKLKKRKGSMSFEMIIVIMVIGVLALAAFGGGTALIDSSNVSVTSQDLEQYSNAVQTALMKNLEFQKWKDGDADKFEKIVQAINDELDDTWDFEAPGTGDTAATVEGSGAMCGTITKRDAFGNAYGLYVFTDSQTPTYTDNEGKKLLSSDSCIYVAIVSAGKNSSGGPMGASGDNFNADDYTIKDVNAMVLNSDGVDDIGVIIRMRNGSVSSASFGQKSSNLGKLDDIQWVYGVKGTDGNGEYYNFVPNTEPAEISTNPTIAGSLDQFPDVDQIEQAITTTPANDKGFQNLSTGRYLVGVGDWT